MTSNQSGSEDVSLSVKRLGLEPERGLAATKGADGADGVDQCRAVFSKGGQDHLPGRVSPIIDRDDRAAAFFELDGITKVTHEFDLAPPPGLKMLDVPPLGGLDDAFVLAFPVMTAGMGSHMPINLPINRLVGLLTVLAFNRYRLGGILERSELDTPVRVPDRDHIAIAGKAHGRGLGTFSRHRTHAVAEPGFEHHR